MQPPSGSRDGSPSKGPPPPDPGYDSGYNSDGEENLRSQEQEIIDEFDHFASKPTLEPGDLERVEKLRRGVWEIKRRCHVA